MHLKLPVFCTLIACLLMGDPCFGQSIPKEKRAEVAFEIRMDKLRGTPIYAMIEQNARMVQSESGLDSDIDFEKVVRVWGAVQLPEAVDDFKAMEDLEPGSALPMELFMSVEFADAETATQAMDELKEQSKEVQVDGKTYYAPTDSADMPSNMLGHMVNSTTIQYGTSDYLNIGAGPNVFSSGLTNAWNGVADDAIRIALDLDNARSLIDELMADARASAPPMMGGMFDLVNKTSNLGLAMDFKDGGNLLSLMFNGADDEAAEELRGGLDGMLAMAKLFGGQAVEEMRQQDEGMADTMSSILRSLSAKRDGSRVDIVIPKPDGFEDTLKSLMQMGGVGNNF